MGRREQLADAGVRLIARGGGRALTHLAVDHEAGLPRGSTSYYARTRRDLIALVVDQLATGSQGDLAAVTVPDALTVGDGVALAADVLERMARRDDAQAARFALLFELRHDDELRAALTTAAPVRASLLGEAERLLTALGVADAAVHAADLVGVMDALLMYRTARAAPVEDTRVLDAYLTGLTCGAVASST